MNAHDKWFVAEAIFQATVRTDNGSVPSATENMLFLVKAVDDPAAVAKAEEIARAKEHSYKNERGQRVEWTFVQLVELTEMIDQDFKDGAELKSKMRDVSGRSSTGS